MHPVLSSALESFTNELSKAGLEDLQASPNPGTHLWCSQQVVEHLLMAIEHSKMELTRRSANSRLPMTPHTMLQCVIKSQLFWFGSMPHGLIAPHSLRPVTWVPADGPALALRLSEATQELDRILVGCRRFYGMEPCGEHPIYGPLRVEEWRAYHARHIRHHLPQLKAALAFSRSQLHLVDFKAGQVDPVQKTTTSGTPSFAIK